MIATPTEKKSVYKSYALHNYRQIPQLSRLTEEQIKALASALAIKKKLLAEKGYDITYGARPLKRIIQTMILDELALE